MSNIFCDVIISGEGINLENKSKTYICTDYIKLVQYYPRLYQLFVIVINSLSKNLEGILSCKMILQYLISFLYLFPEYKYTIYGLLRDVLNHINVSQVLEQNAKILLKSILSDESISESYRTELTEKLTVKELLQEENKPDIKKDEKFVEKIEDQKNPKIPAKIYLPKSKKLETNPKCGYAIKIKIPGSSSYTKIFAVSKNESMIFCGFSIESDKIWFKLTKMENPDEKWENCIEKKQYETAKIPIKLWVLAKEPGLYKAEWSNEDSWVHSRVIKYRILVYEPLLQ